MADAPLVLFGKRIMLFQKMMLDNLFTAGAKFGLAMAEAALRNAKGKERRRARRRVRKARKELERTEAAYKAFLKFASRIGPKPKGEVKENESCSTGSGRSVLQDPLSQ